MTNGDDRRGPLGLMEHELRCLIGLARVIVGLDRQFSGGESEAISAMALEFGEESFWSHMQASYDDELELGTVLALAAKVDRPQAQNAIYAALADLAACDGLDSSEGDVLNRLEQLWHLEITEVG